MQFGSPSALLELPVSWSLDDYPHFEYMRSGSAVLPGLRNTNSVLENWVDDFIYMQNTTTWGLCTYTFHPMVIGRGHRMMMLERLIQKVDSLGATFVRLTDAAEEFKRRERA